MNISKSYFPLIVLLASNSLQFGKVLFDSGKLHENREITRIYSCRSCERDGKDTRSPRCPIWRRHLPFQSCFCLTMQGRRTDGMSYRSHDKSTSIYITHIYLPETFEGNAMVFLYCNYGRMSRESLTTETYVFGGWKFLCITQLIQNQRNFDKRGKIQVKELIKLNFKAFFCNYEVLHL